MGGMGAVHRVSQVSFWTISLSNPDSILPRGIQQPKWFYEVLEKNEVKGCQETQ
jgi:hypothetical protein